MVDCSTEQRGYACDSPVVVQNSILVQVYQKFKPWILMILQVTRNVMTAILSLPPGDIYNLSVTACTERGSNTSMLHLVKLGKKKYMGVYVKTIFQGKLVFASLGFAWYSQLNAVTEKLFTVFFKCKIVYTT